MLEPHGRTLLFDILKPPEQHTLDAAIATTFTLDLLALLTAPVAFSLFDVDDHRELLDQNSLTLVESLRRYADKITVFCQAGYISLPKVQFPQLEFLERSIVECHAKVEGAIFHPKIWLLRFLAPEERVTYRLVCLTRNLTFDRCWDTVLTLEGPLRGAARAANRPLADFIRALPAFAAAPIEDPIRGRVALMSEEVRRVDFQNPEGFEDYAFHPFGIDGSGGFPLESRPGRMLAISPFISDGGIRRLANGRENCILVSRPESLEQPGCQFGAFEKLYVLARESGQEPDDASEDATIDLTRGLHAKCFVVELGSKAHVFTGSTNATEGAFNANVEFLVELVGPKNRFGIDALFRRDEKGAICLGDLLEEFRPEPKQPDDEELGVRAAIERTRHALAGIRFTAVVSGAEDEFSLELRPSERPKWADADVKVECWPVSVGKGKALSLAPDQEAVRFERLSFEAITAFIAFEVTGGEPARSEVFVLTARLQGAPADRRERLLRSFIKDRQRLIRFLLFLLADDSELADALGPVDRHQRGLNETDPVQPNGALLETLLRSLHRSPERLDAVARLIEDVRSQPDSADLLPPAFGDIWEPIWAIRRARKQ
jgi:hypothetical protein